MKNFRLGTYIKVIKVVHEKDKKHEGGGGYWLDTKDIDNKTGFIWLPFTQIVIEVEKVSKIAPI